MGSQPASLLDLAKSFPRSQHILRETLEILLLRGSRPTKSTVGGNAYLALQSKARREHRPTDELIQLYVLEGFLDWLASSRHASNLVLKGGVLLAAYDLRRPTRDVDLQGRRLENDSEAVLQIVKEVAVIDSPDGLIFRLDAPRAEIIRDGADDEYSGVRVALRCSLATADVVFHVDINVGDPIWPSPEQVTLPRLLGGSLVLSGYPLPMVLAEKIVTAVQRGTASTRWRDFADIVLLSARHSIVGENLRRAIAEVARFRHAELTPLSERLQGFASMAQSRWGVWRRKQKLEDADFRPTSPMSSKAATRFADPVIAGDAVGRDMESSDARVDRAEPPLSHKGSSLSTALSSSSRRPRRNSLHIPGHLIPCFDGLDLVRPTPIRDPISPASTRRSRRLKPGRCVDRDGLPRALAFRKPQKVFNRSRLDRRSDGEDRRRSLGPATIHVAARAEASNRVGPACQPEDGVPEVHS